MKIILAIICLFLLLGLTPSFAGYKADLVRVIDGDTIVADIELGLGVVLSDQYIRLYEINTPEITGEEKEQGLIARDYLVERLSSGEIEIEVRPEWGQNGKGSFGRWLGIVYIDGVNINAELVEKGHAEEYEEGET